VRFDRNWITINHKLLHLPFHLAEATMRTRATSFGFVLSAALMLCAACGGRGPGNSPGNGTGEGTGGAVASLDAVRPGPLTAQQREMFYHLAEGSELVPLAWVKAFRNPHDRRKFFLENPERFGLIPDPSNVDGLPVGVTADKTVDLRFLGVVMMGFNCSACHTNEITYQGNRLRIDGGPSRFNAELLGSELGLAIKETIKPLHLIQFLVDLAREPRPVPGAPSVPLTHARHPTVHRWLQELVDAERTAVEDRFLAALDRAVHADSSRSPAVNLVNVPWDSTHPAFQQLMRRYSELRTEGTRAELHAALPQDDAVARDPQATAARHGVIGEIVTTARMLHDRWKLLQSQRGNDPPVPSTPDGPARVDAFGVARNRLYPESPVPTTAPVSYPHLWGFAQNRWLHYDANTTSVMERNLGQALGVGGVFDPVTLKSTLNPVNIHQLELLSRSLEAPAWPAFFPAVDPAKVRRGEPLYARNCAGCHQDPPARDACFPLDEIGTDPLRAVNFATPLGNGRFTDSVAPVLNRMKYAAYETSRVPRDQWPVYNGIPDSLVVWRVTGQYGVRTLAGAWATAPYLHNGSVPSLYELLLPAARRSRTFPVGHPEYDPVRVGYSMTAPAGTFTFDTSLPGNANTGHEYGANLSEEERMALLEYLKTLGAYSGPTQPAGGACPNLNGPVRR
jgi:hypothetical protein